MRTNIELSFKPNFMSSFCRELYFIKFAFSSIILITLNLHNKSPSTFAFDIFAPKMLYLSLDTLLKLSKTTSPLKLFAYDCVTL